MEARDIAESLGVADAKARVRACELERLLRPRTPGGVLAQCRGAASVLLACREHGVRVEAREVALASCVTVDALLGATATCQRILGIQFAISLSLPSPFLLRCPLSLSLTCLVVCVHVRAAGRQWGCGRCAARWDTRRTRRR